VKLFRRTGEGAGSIDGVEHLQNFEREIHVVQPAVKGTSAYLNPGFASALRDGRRCRSPPPFSVSFCERAPAAWYPRDSGVFRAISGHFADTRLV
jgi:hypothetical protein